MDSLIISVEAEKSHKIMPCIRKGNNYMTLNIDVGDDVVSFRDIRNHLPPCNFDEFIQSFKCSTTKGCFPYDSLTSYKALKIKCATLKAEDFPVHNRPANVREYLTPFNTVGDLLEH